MKSNIKARQISEIPASSALARVATVLGSALDNEHAFLALPRIRRYQRDHAMVRNVSSVSQVSTSRVDLQQHCSATRAIFDSTST